MVFLALTSQGLVEAMQAAVLAGGEVWCSASAISEEQFSRTGAPNLTRFAYEIDGKDQSQLSNALTTIQEHHPRQRIWVEAPTSEA